MSGFHLQERDVKTAVGVFRHGFLLRDHLCQLWFEGCALRRAVRRLKRLTDQEILTAHPLPLGAFPLGIGAEFLPHVGQYAYRLGPVGVPLVAQTLGIEHTAVRRRLRKSPSYLGHAVAVASLYVALHRFQQTQNYHLHDFWTELEAQHRFEYRETPHAPWKSADIRPDALAWVEREGTAIPLLIEADMSTQSKAAFSEKLAGYALYRKTPVFTKRFGSAPFRLLIVTTSATRREVLAALVSESDLATLLGVALTTFADFLSHGPLGPIWHCPALGAERNRFDVLSHL